MSGFESPNYTQTPNDFFAMLPDMGEAELRVTLVMIRQTFGFHREGFKMGVTKLAKAAGLSRQGALDGATAAELRGTFRRTNPKEITEAEWELVVTLQPVEGASSQLIPPLQPVEGTPQPGGGQVGVKERINKNNKERTPTPDFESMTVVQAKKLPTLKLYWQASGFWPGFRSWKYIHDTILANGLSEEKIRTAATEWSLRGFKQENIKGILEWAVNGIPSGKNGTPAPSVQLDPVDSKFGSLLTMLARQEAGNE